MLKGLINHFFKEKPFPKSQAVIIPRAEHTISRTKINHNALKVLYRLNQAGFSAYLVGGCVRDLLLGLKPKDFDIATDAHPEEISKLFKNCRLIGRRFRLAHIFFGREIIEVATFRTHHQNGGEQHGKKSQHGMLIRDNVYGTIEDDAWRRDFRMNALYYNIADFSVMDYTGGIDDIKNRILHMIGNPEERFHEDPVRLLRAIRFLAKLDFTITQETEEPLMRLSHLLGHVSSGRLYQEIIKFFQEGATLKTLVLLKKYSLFSTLFPQTVKELDQPMVNAIITEAFRNTDERVKNRKPISPAFLFAVILWYPVLKKTEENEAQGLPRSVAHDQAVQEIFSEQSKRLAIPRLMQIAIREMYFLQYRLSQRRAMQVHRLLDHPRFRASYDLLLLRKHAGEPLDDLVLWWTDFQSASVETREAMVKKLHSPSLKKHSLRRRRPSTPKEK